MISLIDIPNRSNYLTILLEAKKNLLSFVFVREPFERLISSYYDKMDRDWSKPQYDLRWMRDEIIKKLVKLLYWIQTVISKVHRQMALLIFPIESLVNKRKFEGITKTSHGKFITKQSFYLAVLWIQENSSQVIF